MPYNNPTKHELKIGPKMQKLAKRIEQFFVKETGEEVDFLIMVSSKSARENRIEGDAAPVMSYVANMDRESSAMTIAELLYKWQLNGDIGSLDDLRDAQGYSLKDILDNFTGEDMHSSEDTPDGHSH